MKLPYFEIIGPINNAQTIAEGRSVRVKKRLRKYYGGSRWKKMKGLATVRFSNGNLRQAEVHWYQSHGLGKREMKIKRIIG